MQAPPALPHPNQLTQDELLALAAAASRSNDPTQSLALLEEASRRADATGMTLFMLGSEYAQLGLHTEAKTSMARAVEIEEGFHLARFQLGMLHLTTGEGEQALRVLEPLASLGREHPQHYLAAFQRGLLHLLGDSFDDAIEAFAEGVTLNRDNPPLNSDIHRVIDAIEHLPGRQPTAGAVTAVLRPEHTQQTEQPPAPATTPVAEHLFISSYTQGGKAH